MHYRQAPYRIELTKKNRLISVIRSRIGLQSRLCVRARDSVQETLFVVEAERTRVRTLTEINSKVVGFWYLNKEKKKKTESVPTLTRAKQTLELCLLCFA